MVDLNYTTSSLDAITTSLDGWMKMFVFLAVFGLILGILGPIIQAWSKTTSKHEDIKKEVEAFNKLDWSVDKNRPKSMDESLIEGNND